MGFVDRGRAVIRRYPRLKRGLVKTVRAAPSLRAAAARRVATLKLAGARLALWPYSSKHEWLHNLGARLQFALVEKRLNGWHSVGSFREARVSVRVDTGLPTLAWIAVRSTAECEFIIGPGVEAVEWGVFEGVWDGEYDRFRPDGAEYAFGSGAVWPDGDIVFIPPRHLEESLFALHRASDGATFVSNSLPFLFAKARISVDRPFFVRMASHLKQHAYAEGRKGAERVWPVIARDDDYALYQCSYFNFRLDSRGRPHRSWFPARARYRTYAEYVRLLTDKTAELFANGGASGRDRPLRPAVSISSGYDSSAVAALAAQAGCKEALTLRVNVTGHDDSGSHIAAALGLSVTERSHVMGEVLSDLNSESAERWFDEAAEFLATFGIGDDVVFLAFEKDLQGAMLATGVWGDSIWPIDSDVPPGLPVRIPFGKSLSEFRIRVGFAHLPIPFIGGRFPDTLKRISRSEALRPYSVGGSYDRPIPRRIAEEAGVRREDFGMLKRATAPLLIGHAELFPAAMSRVMERYAHVPEPAHSQLPL